MKIFSQNTCSYTLGSLFILLILTGISQTAQARDYAIEVIVFEQARGDSDKDAAQDEKWDFSDRKISSSLQRMVTLESRSNEFQFETTLDRLDPAHRQLIQAGHRILRTARWIQPSAVYQHAPLISLGLDNTSLAYGFVRVYKTSLIYADIDLQYSPGNPTGNTLSTLPPVLSTPVTDEAQADSDSSVPFDNLPEHYFLSEKRRLKFKEIHYFDHPKVGVILGIWPVATT